MVELDYLLGRFLESGYPALSPAQRNAFERLLDVEDNVLWAWLSGRAAASDPELAALVREIRTAR